MHYYTFLFYPTDKLLAAGLPVMEDGLLEEQYYAKREKKLTSLKEAKEFLRKHVGLECEYVDALAVFGEIDATEFECSCGIPA